MFILPEQYFYGAAYLRQNPDVAADPFYGTHPYQHYIEHGAYEISQGWRSLGFGWRDVANLALAAQAQTVIGYLQIVDGAYDWSRAIAEYIPTQIAQFGNGYLDPSRTSGAGIAEGIIQTRGNYGPYAVHDAPAVAALDARRLGDAATIQAEQATHGGDDFFSSAFKLALIGGAIYFGPEILGAFSAEAPAAFVGDIAVDTSLVPLSATGVQLADFSVLSEAPVSIASEAVSASATVTPISSTAIEAAPLPAVPDVPPAVNEFAGDIPVDPALQPLNPGDVQLETFPANAPELPPSLQDAANTIKKVLPSASQAVSTARALLPVLGLTAASVAKANAANTAQATAAKAASGFTYNTHLPASSVWSNLKPYILPVAVVAAILATR